MATPSDKLAQSLEILKSIQDQNIVAIRSSHITRTHRERLLKNGFIKEVMKGWYIPSSPSELPGESTSWYASFWKFAADYLNSRFQDEWCLNPEQSINIHSGDWSVPKQLLVRSPKGGNKPTTLLHDTSIFDVRLAIPNKQERLIIDDIQVMSLPVALIHCTPNHFLTHPIQLRAVLATITDGSDILRHLLNGSHSKISGRLAGAFRNIGRTHIADNIVNTMRSADYKVNEVDPFKNNSSIIFNDRETSPYVNRLRLSWALMRESVLEHFPTPPRNPVKADAYLKQVDDIYITDAYHSLSIEGYKVSHELIKRVQSGDWSPETNEKDFNERNAMAARGYWQAFQAVKQSLEQILTSKEIGVVIKDDHSKWFVELFSPSVAANILKTTDLAGYRNQPVYIRRSKHVPPSIQAVRELMPAFFELLQKEDEPAVRAVLGHFFFVYIHPYIDGNGRMGRFIMNAMLASGGYPWTVVPVERRDEYMSALEEASTKQNIIPFTQFIAQQINAIYERKSKSKKQF